MKKETRFTLIELLIVVAIIAILAGLLLPALNSAREKGKTLTCVSLMKTMTTGAILYADSCNGYVMQSTMATENGYSGTRRRWCTNQFFLDGAGIKYNTLQGSVAVDNYRHTWRRPFLCPNADTACITDGATYGTAEKCWGMQRLWRDLPAQPSAQTSVKLSNVFNPSAKAFFTEVTDGGGSVNGSKTSLASYLVWKSGASTDGTLAYRHNGTSISNLAYYDGHVGSLKESALTDPNPYNNNLVKKIWYMDLK